MIYGFYPGSFDPPTLGHRDIISRGLKLFDRLIIGIGVHPSKATMFDNTERVGLLEQEINTLSASGQSEVVMFEGLTVDAARKHDARCILRGLRDAGDLNYEMKLAGMNKELAPEIDTLFLAASPGTAHITATLVRQIAKLGGDVSQFVSPNVLQRIQAKIKAS